MVLIGLCVYMNTSRLSSFLYVSASGEVNADNDESCFFAGTVLEVKRVYELVAGFTWRSVERQ